MNAGICNEVDARAGLSQKAGLSHKHRAALHRFRERRSSGNLGTSGKTQLSARATTTDRSGRPDPSPGAARRRAVDPLAELRKKFATDVQERVKAVACYMFAIRGVDGVTIREILTAAKVKNAGAVGYYFGSKENLVRQILLDGTQEIDRRRGQLLDTLVETGRPMKVRDIVNVLIHAVTDQPEIEERRFICLSLMVSMTHRELYLTTMFESSNGNFSRCIALLKDLMPDMPASAKHQRLMFMKSNMAMALARREAARSSGGNELTDWALDHTTDQYIRAETAMLSAPFEDDGAWPESEAGQTREVSLITHDPL